MATLCYIHLIVSSDGLVGETALYTRIAECFIKHPSYYFGDPPSLPTLKNPQQRPADLPPLEDITESEDVYFEEPDALERPQSMTSITSGNSEGDSREDPEEGVTNNYCSMVIISCVRFSPSICPKSIFQRSIITAK